MSKSSSPNSEPATARKARRRAPATAKATAEPAAGGLSGLDAAAQVLRDAKDALDAPEMVKRMLARGIWSTNGKTPAATIYAAIIREIRTKGDQARFRKVARGRFEAAR